MCQQQQAQNSCRRSCELCHSKVDSSNLVWYNQNKGSSNQQTVVAYAGENQSSNVTGQKGIGAEAHVKPLVDLDLLTQPFYDPANESTESSGQVESVVDSMLQQQIQVDEANIGQQATQPSNVTQKLQAADQPLILRSQNNMSDQFSSSPNHSRVFDAAVAPVKNPRAESWKDQLSSPLSLFLLCLCSLLLMCTIWLGRSKLRRKKLMR